MKNIKESILLCMMTFAFWGVLYPQFSLTEECYETAEKEKDPQKDFFNILEARMTPAPSGRRISARFNNAWISLFSAASSAISALGVKTEIFFSATNACSARLIASSIFTLSK